MTAVIYKIVDQSEWVEATEAGRYLGSSDDQRDGFIHFSTAAQLDGTAAKHFRGIRNLILVAFDSDTLADRLVWETSRDGEPFPHYYGELNPARALWKSQMTLDDTGIPRSPIEAT